MRFVLFHFWLGTPVADMHFPQLRSSLLSMNRFPDSSSRISILVLIASVCSVPPGSLANAETPVDGKLSFDRDIRPILSEHCFACHGFDANAREADLRLDTREGAIDDGGVIVPGDATSSMLVERILSTNPDEIMPPPQSGRKLTDLQKKNLQRWIAEGAKYETHWAFTPPTATAPPAVGDLDNPIDGFIRARLDAEGISPSPQASPATLLRRVSLDLTGLPPTLEEVEAFEREAQTDLDTAYQSLVNRLLESPHYGERWGRWWLDQARYADSNGYSIDSPREIWKYRDWVIDAINNDMSFDQFTIEQLAGDLLPEATTAQKVATGFHRNTQINQEGGVDREQFRVDSIFDRVGTTGSVWLGLTIGCAQCHDHKFDPITQKDFYRMFAFLNNQDEPRLMVYPDDVDAPKLQSEKRQIESELRKVVDQHAEAVNNWEQALDENGRKTLTKEVQKAVSTEAKKRSLSDKLTLVLASNTLDSTDEIKAQQKRIADINKDLAKGVSTMVLSERTKPRQSTVFIKGDFTRPADLVQPGTPAVLHPLQSENKPATRLDLARWLVAEQNPLTARVIVNRIWQQYFGRGIVETDNDFGLQGTSPSHPELLDWLAVTFRQSGWSMKAIHRQIVMSKTYRQSSVHRKDLNSVDPLNLLLARQNRLRVDAEIVRDVALVASGLFVPKVGGPPVFPPIPDGVMSLGQVRRGWNASRGDDRYRRGLYTFVYRATPPPALNVFDAPDGQSSCTRRIRSNTPLQALTLMNDKAFIEFAEALKQRIDDEGLEAAFIRCTTRRPTEEELELLRQLDPLGAARALLNLDETINRE